MPIAVAVFEDEISPRFDCCAEIAFLGEGDEFLSAERIPLKGNDSERRIRMVLEKACHTLLCGGIRKQDRFRLMASGVTILDGLSGPVADRIRELQTGGMERNE